MSNIENLFIHSVVNDRLKFNQDFRELFGKAKNRLDLYALTLLCLSLSKRITSHDSPCFFLSASQLVNQAEPITIPIFHFDRPVTDVNCVETYSFQPKKSTVMALLVTLSKLGLIEEFQLYHKQSTCRIYRLTEKLLKVVEPGEKWLGFRYEVGNRVIAHKR